MTARLLSVVAGLSLTTAIACGSGSTDSAAPLPATTNYYSCDETYTMGGGPIHTCLEYSNKVAFATPSPDKCTPTANGYMGKPGNGLSTTLHCPKADPGCVCVHDDDGGGHYEDYQYQSADLDAYAATTLLCSTGGTVSCFGGLVPPKAG